MERIFNFKNAGTFNVSSNKNTLKLIKDNKEIATKIHINQKGFYQDEFVSFPAIKMIEKKTKNGVCTIVFGDMAAYGTSQAERYIKIEENGCKFAIKKGRGVTKDIYRAYGDVLSAIKKEAFSITAQKYVNELKNISIDRLAKLVR